MELQWNEVDGVAALSVKEGVVPGPLRACLMFGAGRSDETMLVSGINHAIEHLALQRVGNPVYGWNGQVNSVATKFLVAGRPDQVVEFFGIVARSVRDLPVERLADELRVLRVEDERTGGSQLGFDLSVRFGPQGVGLIGWPEHGLKRVDAGDLEEWVATWFTAANAVLWTSGPVPEGLDLRDLPQGAAPTRAPAPQSIPPPRAFSPLGARFASISVVTDDSRNGVSTMFAIAAQRAFDRLRRRDAISYGIEGTRVRLGGDGSLMYLQADGSEDDAPRVFEGLVAVIDELAASGPTEQEWEHAKAAHRQTAEMPESAVEWLDGSAERHLLGLDVRAGDEWMASLHAMDPDDLRADLAAVMPTLLAVGAAVLGEPAGFSSYERWSAERVEGRVYQPIEGREIGTLVVGDDGVSWVDEHDRHRTVRWDEAVACFAWDDGRRSVLGPSGAAVYLVPWNWRAGHDLTALADEAIGASRWIRLGEGETQYLQNPDDPESAADVRWLGTLVGARHRKQRVDVVVDTDGVFLLYPRPGQELDQERMKHLRASDRETLLADDARNRWIPVDEIRVASLAGRAVRLRFARVFGTLTLCLHDGSDVEIELLSTDQLPTTRRTFSKLLGSRFES